MSNPHSSAEPRKPVNIHRRIVSYGLLLVLAAFAYSLAMSTRHLIHFSDQSQSVVRYDRWTGKVSRWVQGSGAWSAF